MTKCIVLSEKKNRLFVLRMGDVVINREPKFPYQGAVLKYVWYVTEIWKPIEIEKDPFQKISKILKNGKIQRI